MCRARAQEIAVAILGDGFFPCHKTTPISGAEGPPTWCAGATGTLQNDREKWRNNRAIRMAVAMALCVEPPALRGLDRLYPTVREWVLSHEE